MMESGYGILSNDYDWLDSFLRSFPGVTRDYKEEWQWIRYQVGEKMFAAVCKDAAGTRDIITVKLDPLDGKVPIDIIKESIDKSYHLVLAGLPKKKQKEIKTSSSS